MAYVWLCHKNKMSVKGNALRIVTMMSQRIKNLGFVYLSYKKKDIALTVPNTNQDWKGKWFFIIPKDPELDWAFPTVWHKTPLIGS